MEKKVIMAICAVAAVLIAIVAVSFLMPGAPSNAANATIFNGTEIPAEEPEELKPKVTPVTGITEIRDIVEHPENFEGKEVTIIGEVKYMMCKTRTHKIHDNGINEKMYWCWYIKTKENYCITALSEMEPPEPSSSVKIDGVIDFKRIFVKSWKYTN